MTLTSFGPANRIQRSAETHPLTWRLRDDGEAVWLDEYQAKNGYAAARKAFADMDQDAIVRRRSFHPAAGLLPRQLRQGTGADDR